MAGVIFSSINVSSILYIKNAINFAFRRLKRKNKELSTDISVCFISHCMSVSSPIKVNISKCKG